MQDIHKKKRLRFNCLESIRKTRGLTQPQVAKMIGVAQGTISRYEERKTAISQKHIDKLLEVLQVSYYDIFPPIKQKHETNILDINQHKTIEAFNKKKYSIKTLIQKATNVLVSDNEQAKYTLASNIVMLANTIKPKKKRRIKKTQMPSNPI